MEDLPKLTEEHLEKAKEIISRHRTKKNCNRCYDRGYQGVNQLNMAITCYKCVDEDKVTEEWQAYVRDTPELAKAYGDYFESDEAEEAEIVKAEKSQVAHEKSRRVFADRSRRGGASKPHRSVGK